jgi:hypothetical protein
MVERGRNRRVQATCRENAVVVRRCDVMQLNGRDMDGFAECFSTVVLFKPSIAFLKSRFTEHVLTFSNMPPSVLYQHIAYPILSFLSLLPAFASSENIITRSVNPYICCWS